jgi:hypothetical protein
MISGAKKMKTGPDALSTAENVSGRAKHEAKPIKGRGFLTVVCNSLYIVIVLVYVFLLFFGKMEVAFFFVFSYSLSLGYSALSNTYFLIIK